MDSYDFVVVGAGTAGCVMAARLSEDAGAHVLLLEAGSGKLPDAVAEPPAWPTLAGTPANWGNSSVVMAATGTSIPLPRGRGLGGSSAINGMVFARGHRSSYDAWVAAGAKGWGFGDLLPHFRRSEATKGRDPAIRGVDGPLEVAPARSPHPVSEASLAAAAELGYAIAADVNSGLEEGFGWSDLNIVDGRRQSAADAYLARARQRPNLTMLTDTLVHRVEVRAGRCTGVEYSVGGAVSRVECRNDVVLTAGTIGSAQLLMLSGIGPQGHLREVGVQVVLDLPGVGANLHDHPRSTVIYRTAKPLPAGVNNHGEVLGLIRSDRGVDALDLQIQIIDVPLFARLLPPPLVPPGQGFSIAFSAITAASRGSVRLASADPAVAPLVDPNYYADPRDLDVMAAGLQVARAMGRTAALQSWRSQDVLPGPDVRGLQRVRDYLYKSLRTYSHHVGTCRIGTDDMAVVDTSLRVHGIEGLRVADASVMPSIVSANTVATVYGIAERAAALIRA
jgi:choline dehydrogenase-like flavoprotein